MRLRTEFFSPAAQSTMNSMSFAPDLARIHLFSIFVRGSQFIRFFQTIYLFFIAVFSMRYTLIFLVTLSIIRKMVVFELRGPHVLSKCIFLYDTTNSCDSTHSILIHVKNDIDFVVYIYLFFQIIYN